MKPTDIRLLRGFTPIELLIVVWCLLILAALILPALTRPHHYAPRINCLNNLKQDGLAFRTFALDHKDQFPMSLPVTNGGTLQFVGQGATWRHFSVMSNELSTPKILLCPDDVNRLCATTFSVSSPPPETPFSSNSNLSYLAGVDATEQFPNMFLTGDRAIGIGDSRLTPGLQVIGSNSPLQWASGPHNGEGNIGFADGSARQVSSSEMQKALQRSGTATNRLEIP